MVKDIDTAYIVAGYHPVMVQLQQQDGKILQRFPNIFEFTAIAFDLVRYVSILFELSAIFTNVWVWLLLSEEHSRELLLGAGVIVVGVP